MSPRATDFFEHKFVTSKHPDDSAVLYGTEDLSKALLASSSSSSWLLLLVALTRHSTVRAGVVVLDAVVELSAAFLTTEAIFDTKRKRPLTVP